MEIQSASAYAAYSRLNISSHQKQSPTNITEKFSVSETNNTNTVTTTQTARNVPATQSNSAVASGSGATAVFDTNQGSKTLNIDDYFSAKGTTFSLHTPLLLPTQNNIDALTNHISATFPLFLAQNNIPSAPSSITYDNKGQIEPPSDYPHASELKQALANNPTMAKELKTVNALSSHFAEIQKSRPYHKEVAAAATQAEADAIAAKYSYLFVDNNNYSAIALHFSEDGRLSITADDKPLFLG